MRSAFFGILLTMALPGLAFGQFGSNKCDVDVERLVPPSVKLQGPVRVTVRAVRGDALLASEIQRQIESMLLKRDPDLAVSTVSPQTDIEAEITDFFETRVMENRQLPQVKKTGTRQEWNDRKSLYETKDVYETVNVSTPYLNVSGTLKVAWKAVTATKQVVASDVESATLQNSFQDGKNAPDATSVRGQLSVSLVQGLLKKVTPTPEKVEVFVAKGPDGKLEPGCKLAENSQWTRALENWETLPKFKNAKDEAYRIYNIGLAHEVLGYTAGASRDYTAALKYLNKAAENFRMAAEQNTSEKYFKDPQTRIRVSLGYYATLRDQFAGTGGAPIAVSPTTLSGGAAAPAGGGLNNDAIIDFVRAGFSESFVLEQIQTATQPRFSIAPADLVKLKTAGVSERIISSMVQRR